MLAAEATNWDIGDLDGYIQTSDPRVPFGATWHEPATDNVKFITGLYPGLIEERTANYTQILDTLLTRLDTQSVPEPSSVVSLAIVTVAAGTLTRKRKSLYNKRLSADLRIVN